MIITAMETSIEIIPELSTVIVEITNWVEGINHPLDFRNDGSGGVNPLCVE